jgi:phage shock protein E
MDKSQILWFAIPVAAVLGWRAMAVGTGHARVESNTAHELVQNGARLLDVRTKEEYGAKHLPDAINIPVQELSTRIRELEPKDAPIVVYCRSGSRSGIAYETLKAAGFTKVHDLGRMTAW